MPTEDDDPPAHFVLVAKMPLKGRSVIAHPIERPNRYRPSECDENLNCQYESASGSVVLGTDACAFHPLLGSMLYCFSDDIWRLA
jgi:hypothetical protein